MQTKRIVNYSFFLALGLILSYVESLLPFFFGVPGMKLGLANAIVVFLLYMDHAKSAFCVNVLRILLSGFLFGNAFSIIYSLAGGILSFIVMWLCKKSKRIGMIPTSVVGGMFHNIGQLLVAILVMQTWYMIYYLAALLVAGFITGLLIGVIVNEITKRIPKTLFLNQTR